MSSQNYKASQAVKEQKEMEPALSPRARRYRFAQACCMPFIHINIGICAAIVSPTVPDMTGRFKTDYEHYSQSLMMKSVGLFFGSYIGGIATDRFRHKIDWFFAINMFIFGSMNVAQPWYPSLVLMGAIYTVMGVSNGALNVAASSYLIAVWGEAASFPVHMLHIAFTMGQIVGPLISEPFISPTNGTNVTNCSKKSGPNVKLTVLDDLSSYRELLERQRSQNISTPVSTAFQTKSSVSFANVDIDTSIYLPGLVPSYSYFSLYSSEAVSQNVVPQPSPLVFVPYVICGAFSCLVSLIFVAFALIPTPRELLPKDSAPKPLKEIFSPGSCASGNKLYATFMLFCLFLIYTSNVSTGNSLCIWLYPLATKTCSILMSRSEAILLNTMIYVSSTVSRIIWGSLSHCCPIKPLVFIELFTQFGAFAGLAFLGLNSNFQALSIYMYVCCSMMLWIWTNAALFFSAPIYPAVMTWADRYIEVTGLVVAIIDTGIGAGVFFSTWVSGVIFQYKGAQDLFYFTFGCSTALVVSLVAMQIAGSIHGDRYNAGTSISKDMTVAVEENVPDSVDERSPLIN